MLIQNYQEHWVNDFDKVKKTLEGYIQTDDIQIEHVGSTSVKKLAAKPIIDIDLIYEKPASFIQIKKDLEDIGYFHNGNQGIAGREVFKREKKKEEHAILDSIRHHLYVCFIDNEELKRHLAFRDYLRENEKARVAYELLKYDIAQKAAQDRKEYARLKEFMARDFIESIIRESKEV